MNDKKAIILAQVFITMMMAFLMSGIMSLIAMGPTQAWLMQWPLAFIMAWPIAFILTQFVGPLSFKISYTILGRLAARKAAKSSH